MTQRRALQTSRSNVSKSKHVLEAVGNVTVVAFPQVPSGQARRGTSLGTPTCRLSSARCLLWVTTPQSHSPSTHVPVL